MAVERWGIILDFLVIMVFLVESVLSTSTSSLSNGIFIQDDKSAASFSVIIGLYTNSENAVRCASLCSSESLCRGFYYDNNNHECHLAGGSYTATVNPTFNEPGISLYKRRNLAVCPTWDGFKEMMINQRAYCFLYVDNCEKYDIARQECEALGAVLLHFDDEFKKYTLIETIVGMWPNSGRAWVGLHSPNSNDNLWYWDYNNQPMSSAQFSGVSWLHSNIDERTACANLNLATRLIDDDPCTDKNEYVCEFHL